MRFDYTTSPPPPPPGALSLKQQLLLADPFGFELARKAMDDVLPTLSQVATSSIGATIGDYKPDAKMTRAELTKAYLATPHLEDQTSLGARWVQAAYTGVWRKACAELVRFFNDSGARGRRHARLQPTGRRAPSGRRKSTTRPTTATSSSTPWPRRRWRSPFPKTRSRRSGRGTGFAATAGCACRCRGRTTIATTSTRRKPTTTSSTRL